MKKMRKRMIKRITTAYITMRRSLRRGRSKITQPTWVFIRIVQQLVDDVYRIHSTSSSWYIVKRKADITQFSIANHRIALTLDSCTKYYIKTINFRCNQKVHHTILPTPLYTHKDLLFTLLRQSLGILKDKF